MSTGPGDETQASSHAERVARRLRAPLIVAALLAIPTIIVQETDLGETWEVLASVLDWCIWAVFAANLIIMLAVVPNRRRYLVSGVARKDGRYRRGEQDVDISGTGTYRAENLESTEVRIEVAGADPAGHKRAGRISRYWPGVP